MALDTTKGLVISSKMPWLALHAEKFASVTEYQTDFTSKAQDEIFLQKVRLSELKILFFFSFATSITISHNSYKVKRDVPATYKEHIFPYDDN